MKDALDTTFEISKLANLSPKRDSLFEKLKADLFPGVPGFRTLCPMRWAVRGSSFTELWDTARTMVQI